MTGTYRDSTLATHTQMDTFMENACSQLLTKDNIHVAVWTFEITKQIKILIRNMMLHLKICQLQNYIINNIILRSIIKVAEYKAHMSSTLFAASRM